MLDLLKGLLRSNTVQINALILAVWTALINSDMIQANPDIVQIMVGVQSLINILLRMKTNKPIKER